MPVSAAALAAALGGCRVAPPTLSLQLHPAGTAMIEPFTAAYTSAAAGADERIILVRDALSDIPPTKPGAALSPVTIPLRQILTVRLLYQPMPGARGDSPAASNAAFHWYVLGNPDAGVTGLLQYEGTGFASIAPGRHDDAVVIQNATLTLVQQRGELVDPLHTFTINGRFTAHRDDTAADTASAEIDAAEHPLVPLAPSTVPSPIELPTTFPTTLPAAPATEPATIPTTEPAPIPTTVPATNPANTSATEPSGSAAGSSSDSTRP